MLLMDMTPTSRTLVEPGPTVAGVIGEQRGIRRVPRLTPSFRHAARCGVLVRRR
jgi:hypothetical protein